MVLWTDTPICGALQLLQGYLLSLCLSLINALLAWPVSFGGQPSLGRFVVVPHSFNFLNNGFINGAPWDVQRFGYFL